jgi:hypothetical protein
MTRRNTEKKKKHSINSTILNSDNSLGITATAVAAAAKCICCMYSQFTHKRKTHPNRLDSTRNLIYYSSPLASAAAVFAFVYSPFA